jgi:hypothetical protein
MSHKEGITAAVIGLRLSPGYLRVILHETAIANNPQNGARTFHHGGIVCFGKVLRIARGFVRHRKWEAREVAL